MVHRTSLLQNRRMEILIGGKPSDARRLHPLFLAANAVGASWHKGHGQSSVSQRQDEWGAVSGGPIAELIRNRVCRLSESDRDSVGNGRRRRRRSLARAEHFHQRQRASLLLREPGKA